MEFNMVFSKKKFLLFIMFN